MNTQKILALLQNLPKGYLSLDELVNYLKVGRGVVKATLSRLCRQKRAIKLGYGFYAAALQKVDPEQLACEMVYPSYISLEYALSLYGILSQIPASITLITTQKTAAKTALNITLEYSHITSKLFFGYKIVKHTLMAYPEKALLDLLYGVAGKKRKANLAELNLAQINRKKLKVWLKFYPQSTRDLAARLLK
jgi:predicted transcriptional regulator of viral defense system